MKKILVLVTVLSLAVSMVNCGDFLSGGILDNDPNRLTTEPPIETLFVSMQPATWGFYIGDIGFLAVMWMQQIAGCTQQQEDYERYNISSDRFGGFTAMYRGGGLVDMKVLKAEAAKKGMNTYLGLTQMYEALLFACGADAWGDIPYSEACVDDIEHPHYDTQRDVHQACLALLDDAIANFQIAKGEGKDDPFDKSLDFSFGGDLDMMIECAYSLKARIHINWGKVDGQSAYTAALAAAQNGISSTANNWTVPHEDLGNHRNIYYQFYHDRGDYARVGYYLVELLKNDDDPRLEYYLGKDEYGGYSGSKHCEMNDKASWINESTIAGPASDMYILTWKETQFMIAECHYQLGDEDAARTALNNIQTSIETQLGFPANSMPRYDATYTGTALHKAIMLEKYKALFLDAQIWNDWKRTGYPALESEGYLHPDYDTNGIPRRYLYSIDEENTNKNFPERRGLWGRNQNDPPD